MKQAGAGTDAGSDDAPPAASPAVRPELFCPGCGYDLRAAESDRCPECGLTIDRTLAGTRLPWAHRQKIGRTRAYLRTVALAVFAPAQLARRAGSQVSLKAAKRFRLLTVLLAFLPLAVLLVWGYVWTLESRERIEIQRSTGPSSGMLYFELKLYTDTGNIFTPGFRAGWAAEFLVVVASIVGLWLFLIAWTAVPGWFFRPRRLQVSQQERAVAISYYACAALAATPVTVGLLFFLAWSNGLGPLEAGPARQVMFILSVMAVVLPVLQFGSCHVSTLVLLRQTTWCGTGRVLAAAVALPLLWLALAVLVLLALPAATAFAAIIFLSLAR